jgi:hypothetical protein
MAREGTREADWTGISVLGTTAALLSVAPPVQQKTSVSREFLPERSIGPEGGISDALQTSPPAHWFNFRLDTMVDGLENSVHEINSETVPLGPANPHGNAWVAKHTRQGVPTGWSFM